MPLIVTFEKWRYPHAFLLYFRNSVQFNNISNISIGFLYFLELKTSVKSHRVWNHGNACMCMCVGGGCEAESEWANAVCGDINLFGRSLSRCVILWVVSGLVTELGTLTWGGYVQGLCVVTVRFIVVLFPISVWRGQFSTFGVYCFVKLCDSDIYY